MNLPLIIQITVLSNAIPVMAALFMYKRAATVYRIFFFILLLGCASDLLSWLLISVFSIANILPHDLYQLTAYLLFLLLFYKWNTANKKIVYTILAATGIVLLFADWLFITKFKTNAPISKIFYSFVIIYLSVDKINDLVIKKNATLKNSVLIICIGLLIFYSYRAFVISVILANPPMNRDLQIAFYEVLAILNIITNLIYTYAILCITSKQEFSLRY